MLRKASFTLLAMFIFTPLAHPWFTYEVTYFYARYTSIATDSLNHPHIAYTDYDLIRYARWTGTMWQFRSVDGGQGRLSLALDTLGLPHMTYKRLLINPPRIRYAFLQDT